VASRFDPAIEWVLSHEGGAADHPDDRGGVTRWGISSRVAIAAGWVEDEQAIRSLTRDQAIDIYRSHYWTGSGLAGLVDQAIATKTFDLLVHAGPVAATEALQRALGRCGRPVAIDGRLGPITTEAANAAHPCRLLLALAQEQRAHYARIIRHRPSQQAFQRGWFRRAADLPEVTHA
jgi:typhoid toxin secretion A